MENEDFKIDNDGLLDLSSQQSLIKNNDDLLILKDLIENRSEIKHIKWSREIRLLIDDNKYFKKVIIRLLVKNMINDKNNCMIIDLSKCEDDLDDFLECISFEIGYNKTICGVLIRDEAKPMIKYIEKIEQHLAKNIENFQSRILSRYSSHFIAGRIHIIPVTDYDNALRSNLIGILYQYHGRLEKAKSEYEKSLEILTRINASEQDIATVTTNLGSIYEDELKYPEALDKYTQSLSLRLKTSSSTKNPEIARSYHNIGIIYYKMSDYKKSLSHYENSLRLVKEKESLIDKRQLSKVIAATWNNIGLIYLKQRKYDKALEMFQSSFDIRKSLPSDHPDIAASLNNIGLVYRYQRKYSMSLKTHQKALEINKISLPHNHPNITTSLNNMAKIHMTQKKYDKAVECYKELLEIRKQCRPLDKIDMARMLERIGYTYKSIENFNKAFDYLTEAYFIYINHDNPDMKKIREIDDELKCFVLSRS